MNSFETLCEGFGIIKKTTRVMYPRKVQMSEKFLAALKEEYISQKMLELEKADMAIKDRPAAFVKAVMFHIGDLEKNAAMEIEAMRAKLSEDTSKYQTKEEGKPAPKNDEKSCKKMELRKKQIPLENMKKDMMGKASVCPCKTKKA